MSACGVTSMLCPQGQGQKNGECRDGRPAPHTYLL
jgi:hypothetical protein